MKANPAEPLDHNSIGRHPAREHAGLREIELSWGGSIQEMTVPRWLADGEGFVAPGALGVVADSALGNAMVSTVGLEHGMVTSHLHLELLQTIPLGTTTIRAVGRQAWLQDRFGFGAGEIATGTGVALARASIGSVLIEGGARVEHDARASERAAPWPPDQLHSEHPLLDGAPVHAALGTEIVDADDREVRLLVTAAPELANSAGGIHGGFGVLIGERALDVALRHALDGARRMRLADLRCAFLRPIVADGARIECRATVVHLGRRLAATRGEVRDRNGQPSLLVDATYLTD